MRHFNLVSLTHVMTQVYIIVRPYYNCTSTDMSTNQCVHRYSWKICLLGALQQKTIQKCYDIPWQIEEQIKNRNTTVSSNTQKRI